jgi:hypothetical protein
MPLALTAVLGMEFAPLTYAAEPGWRASFAFRRPLVVPLNFLGFRPCESAAAGCRK